MKMTPSRAEIVRALQKQDAYLLIRSASDVPAPRRASLLTGTKLVVLVDGQEKEVEVSPKLSGMSANGLIDAGYLEVKEARQFGGRLYGLSDKGLALELPLPAPGRKSEGWDATRGPRVFQRDLNEMAAELCAGASVALNSTRHWWELVIPGEEERRIPLTNVRGNPIFRLNDLSLGQWRETLTRAAETK